jgi:integrase
MSSPKRPRPGTNGLPRLDGHPPRERAGSIDHPDHVLKTLPIGTPDYIRVVGAILKKHNALHSAKHKGVSVETMVDRARFLVAFWRELRRKTKFNAVDPRQLNGRHVECMVARWLDRRLATATIHNYLSFLRTYAGWIGKPGLVRPPEYYVGADSPHAHRSYVATEDHSWTARNIDIEAKIQEVSAFDERVGLQLELCYRFGLRAKEARFLRPCEALVERDLALPKDAQAFPEAATFLRISRGAKGGRHRDVPIKTDAQRAALARAQALCPDGAHLGQPGLTAMQAQTRFYYVVRKFGISKRELGVVAHGLRHQRVNDDFSADAGERSPVRGATSASADDESARERATRLLGHSRTQITNCYLGSSTQLPQAVTVSTSSTDADAAEAVCEGSSS